MYCGFFGVASSYKSSKAQADLLKKQAERNKVLAKQIKEDAAFNQETLNQNLEYQLEELERQFKQFIGNYRSNSNSNQNNLGFFSFTKKLQEQQQQRIG
jgi:hypothetical protein